MLTRNLVVCLDGTNNEPERSHTNVARIFELVDKSATQIAYYDPGVGTMGARSATTRVGQALSRIGGLALGHGIRTNVEEAYTFLLRTYERGDRIYIFGFSRGAYTALALCGLLRTVGLLRPGAENLVPYALKLYTADAKSHTADATSKYWETRNEFDDTFGNPNFPNRFAPQIEYLGLWDTVKWAGFFNWRAQFEQSRWPFTRKIPNVVHARLALALHERRRFYADYRFDKVEVSKVERDLAELWFNGVHSDVGGTFADDHRLADLALQWITDEAIALGLHVNADAYSAALGVAPGVLLPIKYGNAKRHPAGLGWWIAGLGWRSRRPRPSDKYHTSVAAPGARPTVTP